MLSATVCVIGFVMMRTVFRWIGNFAFRLIWKCGQNDGNIMMRRQTVRFARNATISTRLRWWDGRQKRKIIWSRQTLRLSSYTTKWHFIFFLSFSYFYFIHLNFMQLNASIIDLAVVNKKYYNSLTEFNVFRVQYYDFIKLANTEESVVFRLKCSLWMNGDVNICQEFNLCRRTLNGIIRRMNHLCNGRLHDRISVSINT